MSSPSSDIEKLATGIEGLDQILDGGLLRGAAYLVQGPPGAGKTILSNQICFNHTDQGASALYVSLLAESHDKIIRYMQRLGFYAEDRVPRLLSYISAYSTLQKEGLHGVVRLMAQEARRQKASLVVLDGLFVVHDVAESENDFRTFVHELQGQAALLGTTLLLLTNHQRLPSSAEFTMLDGWIEMHDVAHGIRSVRSLTVRKQRGSNFIRGEHYFRITDRGIRVFPRLEASLTLPGGEDGETGQTSTGLEALDTMLHGGYPTASATMLYGPTGAGKTTLGLQFLSRCTADEPGLFYGLYETPKRLVAKARSIGIDLQALMDSGALTVAWRSPAENLVDELGHDLLTLVEKTKARRVFVDGLSVFRSSLIYKERLAHCVYALNLHLRAKGATVVWTVENKELFLPNEFIVDDISAVADNIVLVHYALRDGILRRNISILKVRDSNFDPISEEFFIGDTGVQFGAFDGAELKDLRPKGALPDPTTPESTQKGITRRTGKKGR